MVPTYEKTLQGKQQILTRITIDINSSPRVISVVIQSSGQKMRWWPTSRTATIYGIIKVDSKNYVIILSDPEFTSQQLFAFRVILNGTDLGCSLESVAQLHMLLPKHL